MDFSKLLKTALPWIGAAATGNVPALIAMAAKEVSAALGVEVEAKPEAIGQAVAGATHEQIMAMRERDLAFQERMQAMGFKSLADLEALATGDRADARDMLKTTRSWVPAALSVSITLGYFAILMGLMAGKLELSDSQAMLLMLGSLTTAWGGVLAFWFGTTASSGEKTRLLAQAPAK